MPTSRLCKVQAALQPTPEHHGPLHGIDADWATANLSRDTSHAKIAHLLIPTHFSNIIWESLTNVPNIQAGREQLHTVFTQPPTYFFWKNQFNLA